MNWRAFFKRYGDYVVPARYYESKAEFDVEQMYQAFKDRLEAERRGESEDINELPDQPAGDK